MDAFQAAQGAEAAESSAAGSGTASASVAQSSLAPCLGEDERLPQQQAAPQQQDAHREPVEAAAAAAASRQAAAAGDSSGGPSGGGQEQCDSEHADEEDEEGCDAELGAWLAGRLQRVQPDAELDAGSVRVLGRLLDELTARVLDEACRVNAASGAHADATEAAASGAEAGPAAQAGGSRAAHELRRGHKLSTLTSLDIHKALKRVLPGEPSDGKLRPYLPSVTKQAWSLDKRSLKGIKRQKQAVALGGAAAAATVLAAGGADSKENEQPQGPAE
ncbi:hypothetical protein ABPG75_003216 [Micractinium tetrahymenae]